MQIVRTLIWVLILIGILSFSFFNWKPAEVLLWDDIVWETRLPALVVIAFALGLVPMWLYHRSVKWSLNRRIRSLENSVKSNALAHRHEPSSASAPSAMDKPADKPVEKPAEPADTLAPASDENGAGNT